MLQAWNSTYLQNVSTPGSFGKRRRSYAYVAASWLRVHASNRAERGFAVASRAISFPPVENLCKSPLAHATEKEPALRSVTNSSDYPISLGQEAANGAFASMELEESLNEQRIDLIFDTFIAMLGISLLANDSGRTQEPSFLVNPNFV